MTEKVGASDTQTELPITAPQREQKDLEGYLVSALRRIIRSVDVQSKSMVKTSGLTTPQVVALRACAALGEVTTGRLSKEISLSQGTVTAILDRLDAKGLIERYRSASDRRVVHARITADGLHVLSQTPTLLNEGFTTEFAQLPEQDRQHMVEVLMQFADMMDRQGPGRPPVPLTPAAAADTAGQPHAEDNGRSPY